jgi:hypothetical protein
MGETLFFEDEVPEQGQGRDSIAQQAGKLPVGRKRYNSSALDRAGGEKEDKIKD